MREFKNTEEQLVSGRIEPKVAVAWQKYRKAARPRLQAGESLQKAITYFMKKNPVKK